MDIRDQILEAALKIYAEAGTRGATTRRIANEAGVNEVTLFRHFGSKETLIREALGRMAEQVIGQVLPHDPVDPEAELTLFCQHHYQGLRVARAFIRKTLGEFEEHPDICSLACDAHVRTASDLHAYLLRLRAAGLVGGDWHVRAATSMLLGTLFSDALGRDCMPHQYSYSEPDGIRHYVGLFLQSIGYTHSLRPAR